MSSDDFRTPPAASRVPAAIQRSPMMSQPAPISDNKRIADPHSQSAVSSRVSPVESTSTAAVAGISRKHSCFLLRLTGKHLLNQ